MREEFLRQKIKFCRGHKIVKESNAKKFIQWLSENYEYGLKGDPISFTGFQRYDGIS